MDSNMFMIQALQQMQQQTQFMQAQAAAQQAQIQAQAETQAKAFARFKISEDSNAPSRSTTIYSKWYYFMTG